MITLKSKKYYEENKKIFNHYFNNQWKSMAGRPYLGNCSYLFLTWRPKTYQEFFDRYISEYDNTFDFDTCKGNCYCGRSEEQINALAEKYWKKCNYDPRVSLEKCKDDIINHAIIETFDGHQAELEVMNYLSNFPEIKVTPCEGVLDAVYGIDIIAKPNKGRPHYIQIKPITTFLGNNNQSLIRDRKNFFAQQPKIERYLIKEGRSDEISEKEYMCYDKRHYERTKEISFLDMNGKKRFGLSELINNNGTTKLIYDNLVFKKLKI